MGFSLYNLFKAGLLFANAFAILHPKRVLAKHKLTQADLVECQDNPMKIQLIGLLQAVTYLRLPLVVCNLLVVVVEFLVGG